MGITCCRVRKDSESCQNSLPYAEVIQTCLAWAGGKLRRFGIPSVKKKDRFRIPHWVYIFPPWMKSESLSELLNVMQMWYMNASCVGGWKAEKIRNSMGRKNWIDSAYIYISTVNEQRVLFRIAYATPIWCRNASCVGGWKTEKIRDSMGKKNWIDSGYIFFHREWRASPFGTSHTTPIWCRNAS